MSLLIEDYAESDNDSDVSENTFFNIEECGDLLGEMGWVGVESENYTNDDLYVEEEHEKQNALPICLA